MIQRGDTDKWDFCLRRLFVLKNTPLKTALKYVSVVHITFTAYADSHRSSLAPGATSLIKDLTDARVPLDQRVKPTKSPRDLTLADWTLLLRAFNNWPFRPEVCFVFL